jgi:hypothetical protein
MTDGSTWPRKVTPEEGQKINATGKNISTIGDLEPAKE